MDLLNRLFSAFDDIADECGLEKILASRMESSGLANQIQVSSQTHDRLEGQYRLEPRGKIEVKGKGQLETHILLGPRLAPTSHPE